ncbi:MAG TPA: bifunctional 5,10-methylenetetrahydrofolate dehydrogenase/5,10-methenyltetrahydrofolate cyclohydrolase [Candidatus Paceibacterota bacterium]|nr:bifunctional 5,10-methylenetetrahydrofolate dehydrogenase/5,10-methenyltetrahydrofolate cyclohydrolase [Candidatus Paceibacterota bacterium]
MVIVDGKNLAREVLDDLKPFFAVRKTALAVISVGDNPASSSFIKEKSRVAGVLGIEFLHFNFTSDVSNKFLRAKIGEIVRRDFIKGVIIQLPLPKKFNVQYLLNAIPVEKDPDLLNERSFGAFLTGRFKIIPPAAEVVKIILEKYGINPQGKVCAVFGAGRLVGLTVANWLTQEKATVFIINEFTKQPEKIAKKADILISGVGEPGLITKKMIKKGAVVIDFGYGLKNGKIKGDVDFEKVKKRSSLITPTPGGTGPLLVAALFQNLWDLMNKEKE